MCNDNDYTKYVAGLLFSKNKKAVLLILKKRPSWQKGKLNAIGGHVEEGETCHEAMVREFKEETGLLVPDWRNFCTLTNETHKGVVEFYCAFGNIYDTKSLTDENIYVATLSLLPTMIIPNLAWLIPMALADREKTTVIETDKFM